MQRRPSRRSTKGGEEEHGSQEKGHEEEGHEEVRHPPRSVRDRARDIAGDARRRPPSFFIASTRRRLSGSRRPRGRPTWTRIRRTSRLRWPRPVPSSASVIPIRDTTWRCGPLSGAPPRVHETLTARSRACRMPGLQSLLIRRVARGASRGPTQGRARGRRRRGTSGSPGRSRSAKEQHERAGSPSGPARFPERTVNDAPAGVVRAEFPGGHP